jgi:hypothetical protein
MTENTRDHMGDLRPDEPLDTGPAVTPARDRTVSSAEADREVAFGEQPGDAEDEETGNSADADYASGESGTSAGDRVDSDVEETEDVIERLTSQE